MIVTASISRALLSLGDLDLNDLDNYQVAAGLDPGDIKWRRQRVSSPYVDGEFTTHRSREAREMKFGVWVRGTDWGDIQAKIATLDAAFYQDSFVLSWVLGGDTTSVIGETADRSIDYRHEFLHGNLTQLVYTFPSHPDPETGVL